MATSLVQRTKQIISAEGDDFFRAETILYYINKSARNVVNYMTQQELRPTVRVGDQVAEGAKRSLRALDKLRATETTTLATLNFTDQGDYFTGEQAFPSDLLQVLYLRYNQGTILRELNSQQLHLLDWGNLVPSAYEGYFYINDNTGASFELYLHENPDSNDLVVFYIKEPTEITDVTTETFTDIPEQLENAVLYGAAMMMIGQESVQNPDGNVQSIMNIYQRELEAGKF